MEVNRIIAEIDAQISEVATGACAAGWNDGGRTAGRGRPKGSKNAAASAETPRKRKLSPEGRKRIADAMKKRWAERRKQNAKS